MWTNELLNSHPHSTLLTLSNSPLLPPAPTLPHLTLNMAKKEQAPQEVVLSKKDKKKVDKLTPKIAFHEGKNEKDEAQKIRDQIANIWEKARVDQGIL